MGNSNTTITVGYGDISPTSTIGKIIAVILMFIEIGLVSMVTTNLTSLFNSKKQETELEKLREEIIELKELINNKFK